MMSSNFEEKVIILLAMLVGEHLPARAIERAIGEIDRGGAGDPSLHRWAAQCVARLSRRDDAAGVCDVMAVVPDPELEHVRAAEVVFGTSPMASIRRDASDRFFVQMPSGFSYCVSARALEIRPESDENSGSDAGRPIHIGGADDRHAAAIQRIVEMLRRRLLTERFVPKGAGDAG